MTLFIHVSQEFCQIFAVLYIFIVIDSLEIDPKSIMWITFQLNGSLFKKGNEPHDSSKIWQVRGTSARIMFTKALFKEEICTYIDQA